MKSRPWFILAALPLALVACGGRLPTLIEVTREVEVTRQVEVTRIVEVTPAGAPAAATEQAAPSGDTLAKVEARGKLVCGINGQLPGFSFGDPGSGTVTGFDVDFC